MTEVVTVKVLAERKKRRENKCTRVRAIQVLESTHLEIAIKRIYGALFSLKKRRFSEKNDRKSIQLEFHRVLGYVEEPLVFCEVSMKFRYLSGKLIICPC